MIGLVQTRRWGWKPALLAGFVILLSAKALNQAAAQGADSAFGGSSYIMHGPGPAYGGAYSNYGSKATGLTGRFSASYGEYGAVPGYGRFGAGSSYGTGPTRAAGTGRGVHATVQNQAPQPRRIRKSKDPQLRSHPDRKRVKLPN